MPVEAQPGWTDERIAQLLKLDGEGTSASKIAKALGGITRNAVIGKLSRLKGQGLREARATRQARLAPPPPPAPKPVRPQAMARASKVAIRIADGPFVAVATSLVLPTSAPVQVLPAGTRVVDVSELPIVRDVPLGVTIDDLRDLAGSCRHCRFPLGDPSDPAMRYCGLRTTAPARPYCEGHDTICFVRPGRRAA